jgi:hypothetical protein
MGLCWRVVDVNGSSAGGDFGVGGGVDDGVGDTRGGLTHVCVSTPSPP